MAEKEWTPEVVRDHLLAIVAANNTRYEDKFAASDKSVLSALTAQEKAVNAALAASEKAVAVAEANAEKWRTNANEWRAAMNDRERNFLSKGMGYVVGALSSIALIFTILGHIPK